MASKPADPAAPSSPVKTSNTAGRPATKDIWQIIQSSSSTSATATAAAQQEQQDINVLFLGNKGTGKTSLINRFIRKEGSNVAPKPTTALEYCHVKIEEPGKPVKVAHLWELGGGQRMSSLVDVVITPDNIHTVVVAIVVDLTSPHNIFESILYWRNRVKTRLTDCFTKMTQKGASVPGKMYERMIKRLGEQHPDLNTCKQHMIEIPIVIVATKYDAFKQGSSGGSEESKVIMKTLRYLSHNFGATLIATHSNANKDAGDREAAKYRAVMNQVVFGAQLNVDKILQFDVQSAVVVLCGRDTFENIGPPPGAAKPPGFVSCGNDEFDKWKIPFDTLFPKPQEEQDAVAKDTLFDVNNPDYEEPVVDAMRKVKNEELEQYRQQQQQQQAKAKQRGGASGV